MIRYRPTYIKIDKTSVLSTKFTNVVGLLVPQASSQDSSYEIEIILYLFRTLAKRGIIP